MWGILLYFYTFLIALNAMEIKYSTNTTDFQAENSSKILSRRKRFVTFPVGSSVSVSNIEKKNNESLLKKFCFTFYHYVIENITGLEDPNWNFFFNVFGKTWPNLILNDLGHQK
jgi:hypothetical protein